MKTRIGFADRLRRYVRGRLDGLQLDENTEAFAAHCRRKFKRRTVSGDGVVLVGLFSYPPLVCAYAYAANFLAREAGAAIETFSFGRHRNPQAEVLFKAFGATGHLGWKQAEVFRADAEQFAEQTWKSLRCKEDILRICIDDLLVGDLIHDTYLRMEYLSEADLSDPVLRTYIRDAWMMTRAFQHYFDTHKVQALIPPDAGFMEPSIPQRLAVRAGIPTYLVPYLPLRLVRFDEEFRAGDPANHRYWPCKGRPYARFRETFARLSPQQQEAARSTARRQLTAYLGGEVNTRLIPSGHSAYAPASGTRLLQPTSKPKMLVLLHDVCDCPHAYRGMLFPDFAEWTRFLLDNARETPFEWYVKPHPHTHAASNHRLNDVNQGFFEQLRGAYPEIHFLGKEASNSQLIAEGVQAMFTIYGTATAEFAYFGVPVITAGDHPAIDYNFSFNARTLEEYRSFIQGADRLELEIDKEQIEEFYYMWHIHGLQIGPNEISMIPGQWSGAAHSYTPKTESETFLYFMENDSPERDRLVDNTLQQCLASHRSNPYLKAQFPPSSNPPSC